ncbi:FBD-associated F-box protein [Hirschfeldia incana]|nr:FBD-associated F-box protein [Hirschfeldia incana]
MEVIEEKEKGICPELPSRGDDVISNLPDSLISQMLSCLPTKEAVRTSVLSTRWKSLWILVPRLCLASHDFHDYSAFVSFVDKSLDLYIEENSCLHKLELVIRKDDNDQSCVTRWIDFVAKRKVKHVDVECILVNREFLEAVPLSLYTCESLLYLRLHRVSLCGSESVSLPCLKTMSLEQNIYADEAFLKSFISSCAVLEDLSIVRRDDDNVKALRVHCQTLTSLTLGFQPGDGHMLFHYFGREILELYIDSPRLKYLNFNDDVSKCQILSNLIISPSVKVNLGGVRYMSYYPDGVSFSNQQVARSFFTCISRVKDLVISETIMKLIDFCMKVEQLPQFFDLSCLEAKVCLVDMEMLPTLLASFPNLNSIVLELTRPTIVTEEIIAWSVPQCLLSTLEFVEIKCCCKAELVGMKLAEYFAENSVFLKKLVLRWRGYVLEEDSVLRDLLALSWRSSTCQIEVCGPLNKTCMMSL